MSNRNAVAGRLWQAAEHNIIAEWICCEPLEPGHTLCAQGYAAMRMLKALLVDDPKSKRAAGPSAVPVCGKPTE